MKKYTMFLFSLLSFAFVLLGFNVNSANATGSYNEAGYASGCLAGDNFSRTTGQPCTTTTTVIGCLAGFSFSPVTGQRCTAENVNSGIQTNTGFSDTLFKRELAVGSKGEDVKALQQILKDSGFLSGKVDGSYGPMTKGAVVKYQTEKSISATGKVDENTLRAIKLIPWYQMCPLINKTYGVSYPCPTVPDNQLPVISGVSGPQYLDVSKQGAWTVKAYSSNGGNLSYSVVWGDEAYLYPQSKSSQPFVRPFQQSATFEHSYAKAGNYTPTFTVTSENTIQCITTPCPSNGGSAQVSLSVKVGNISATPGLTVLSPNGGETLQKGTMWTIKWQENSTNPPCPLGANCFLPPQKFYDIKLAPYYQPCIGERCPMYAFHDAYTISKNIAETSYRWSVGKVLDLDGGLAPDGTYTIQVCQSGTDICDSSDSYFKITSTIGVPVISSLSPTSGQINTLVTVTGSNFTPTGNELRFACFNGSAAGETNLSSNGTILNTRVPSIAIPVGTVISYPLNCTVTVHNSLGISNSIPFTLTSSSVQPSIAVLSPNGGEVYKIGDTVPIRFTSRYNLVFISLMNAAGTNTVQPERISGDIHDTGSFSWTIGSNVAPGNYRIGIANSEGADAAFDVSDSYFTITSY